MHILFVPMLFWSFMVCVAHLPMLMFFDRFPFNFSFALAFLYIFYYLLLEPVAGVQDNPSLTLGLILFRPPLLLLLNFTYSANVFAIKTGFDWKVPLIIQAVGWTSQILSHVFIEKRSPAFLENMMQAFLLAPLFVFMEFLFVLGYRPALQKRIHEKIKAAISTYKLRKERRISAEHVTSHESEKI